MFSCYYGRTWNGVDSLFINDNNEFICYNWGYTSKYTADEGMTFKVSYDAEKDLWLIFEVDAVTQEAPQMVIYTKDSEGIADGLILENAGEIIDTANTSQNLVFDSSFDADTYNDGSELFTCAAGEAWDGVDTFFINDNADAVRALAEATLEYGEAANEYFAYGALFAGTGKAQEAINTVKTEVTPALSVHANGKVTGVSFVALTKPEFRFYTSLTEEEAIELNKQINVTTGNAKAQFVQSVNTGVVMLEVTDIEAANMGDEVNITIGDWTITFRGNDFAWLLVQNSETAVLGAALYNYSKAANACFTA